MQVAGGTPEDALGMLPGGRPEHPCGRGNDTTSDAEALSAKARALTTNVADADVLSASAGAPESDATASSRVTGGAQNTWPPHGETNARFVFLATCSTRVSPHIGNPTTLRG